MAAAAAAGVAAVLVGALSGPAIAGAQESQHIDIRARLPCVLPAGPQPVELRVTATFPPTAGTGEPIRRPRRRFELTVPPAALAELPGRRPRRPSIVRLDTAVAQGDGGAAATWTAVQDVPVPPAEEGDVGARRRGRGPSRSPSPRPATCPSRPAAWPRRHRLPADGTVTEPPSVELTCVPRPRGRTPLLAVVPVSDPGDGAAPPSRTALPNPGGGGIVGRRPRPPRRRSAPRGVVPPECHPITPPPNQVSAPTSARTWPATRTSRSSNASVLQPPGMVNIAAGRIVVRCNGDPKLFCQKATVLPDLGGQPDLPPAPGSFSRSVSCRRPGPCS